MPAVAITAQDFEELNELSLDDLYANLALSETGTANSLGFALEDLSSIRSVMSAEDSASTTNSSRSWFVDKGRALFKKLWPAVKGLVCRLYKEDSEKGPLKDWVSVAATAIAGMLSLTAAAAVFIIKIAIELGLDSLCEVAPQA
ncbi:MAG TPA: hypothetical protein VF559_05125 [Caulobacteraceae bacterium]|jgi:hypothetical protein